MSNLYFSICALFCIVLIVLLFFSKEKINNYETKIYSLMIIGSLIDIIIEIALVMIAYFFYNDTGKVFITILNKIDFIYYIWWPSLIFLYILNLILKEGTIFKYQKIVALFNTIFVIIELFLPLKMLNDNNVMGIVGVGTYFVFSVAVIYVLMTAILILFKVNKKITKKYIPFIVLLFLLIAAVFIRVINPTLLIIPSILVYIDLIMYFTIENPDLKMLRKMELAKTQAEKANRAKSDFLSSMSHEIRTPLNAIVGFSEDIQSHKDKVDPEIAEDADYIMEASKTLLEIVGNILDINKIEANKMELVETTYNFRKTIEKLARIDATRIGEKPIDFKVSIAEDIPYELYGDKTHMKEIVNNLLTNAIKYTDKGSIELTVKCINQNDISNLIITVKDTGRGIKKENIEKLFDKFERLEAERNSTTEGTGLGLAITKALVEMMGGKINVSSKYGQGSIFVVQIPQKISKLSAPEKNEIDMPKLVSINSEKKEGVKKILIVDDNELNIKMAKRLLQEYKYEIDECHDGLECLDKVKIGNEYDLILMDIMMPNMSGESAMAKLKENPNFNIPTIALTADAVAGAEEKYINEGFVDYIAKPFNKEQIKEKLDRVFNNTSTQSNSSAFDDSVIKKLSDMSKPLNEIEIDNNKYEE